MTTEGFPYGPERFKAIVKERFFITKNCNTSYEDVGKMTPQERTLLIEVISEQLTKEGEALKAAAQSHGA